MSLPAPDDAVHDAGPDPEGLRGQRQLAILTDNGLRPDHDLLDIGCGNGRLAYECAGYLDGGSYTGIDVSRPAIDWLREHYAGERTDLHFDHLDVHSPKYQKTAEQAADSVRFPYDDASFDYVCSFAVFMHMFPPEIGHYFDETRRVLRPDGRALFTIPIVFDPDDPPATRGGVGPRPVPIGDGVWAPAEGHQASMAFDRDLIAALVAAAGLHVARFMPHILGAGKSLSFDRHDAAGGDALILQLGPPDVPATW